MGEWSPDLSYRRWLAREQGKYDKTSQCRTCKMLFTPGNPEGVCDKCAPLEKEKKK